MWLWIISGFNVILSVHGFASGGFPQSCNNMLPQHGSHSPQLNGAPFEISFQPGNDGGPFTVSLRSTDSGVFRGFMLEARGENGPVGTFSQSGANRITPLDCEGSVASAVSQANNQDKKSFEVNWTPPGAGISGNIDLRATFVRNFSTFWINVRTPLNRLTTTTTVPSTTQPITTQRTTQANTTPSTTQANTTPSTTQANTTPSMTQANTTPKPPPVCHKKRAVVLMVVDSALLVIKMELCNIITYTITNSRLSRLLDKILKLLCLVLSGALEISVLVLITACHPPLPALVALVCVMIILTLVEIVFVSLPLGPSHELKPICDLGAKVCSVIHEALTIAFIYICYLEITDTNRRESWPLWVLIAYTAWTLLFVVWIFVMTTQKHVILRRRKKVSSMSAAHEDERKKKRLPEAVPVIPVIFILGTIAFAAVLIVGILQLPEK